MMSFTATAGIVHVLKQSLLKKGKKINKVEVNIKIYHVTYVVLCDFNFEGHNIIIKLLNNILTK